MVLRAERSLPAAPSRGTSGVAHVAHVTHVTHAGTADSAGLHRLDIPGQEPGDPRRAINLAVPCLMLLMLLGTLTCTALFTLWPQARIQAHETTHLPSFRHTTRSRSLAVAHTSSDSDLLWCSSSLGKYRLKAGESCATVAGKPCKVPSLSTPLAITTFNDKLAGVKTNVCSTPLALICYPPPLAAC